MENRRVYQAFLAPIPIYCTTIPTRKTTPIRPRHTAPPQPHPHHPRRRNATIAPQPNMTSTPQPPTTDDNNTPSNTTANDATTPPQSPNTTTSASEILKTLREDSAADMQDNEVDDRAARSMLGVYRDVDGRSNVWAVEPLEETDTKPQISKTAIIAFAAIFIVAALLLLPLLPFTNPDQA